MYDYRSNGIKLTAAVPRRGPGNNGAPNFRLLVSRYDKDTADRR